MASLKKLCSKCGKIIDYNARCSCSSVKKLKRPNVKCFYSTYRWRTLRKRIINRDGGFCKRCYALGGMLITDDLQVHHIKSREHYPELEYDEDNLITICARCNKILGISDELDFNWEINQEEVEFNL